MASNSRLFRTYEDDTETAFIQMRVEALEENEPFDFIYFLGENKYYAANQKFGHYKDSP